MSHSKIRVLFHSNHSKIFTGFGKNLKNILIELSKDDRFEVFEAANGLSYSEDAYTPWKTYGTFPEDPYVRHEISKDGSKQRAATYGYYCIDKIVKKVKPDVYIGIEDIWAFKQFETKKWWDKTKKIIWTTLDSSPILPEAYEKYNQCEKMLVWASFAEREMKSKGCKNVKTIHGAIDNKNFYPLGLDTREKLRKKFGLENNFVIGFVFKNQLRKSVPNLLEGFKRFKLKHPKSKPKLLLHTDWMEKNRGWDIQKYLKEKDINQSDVLATYVCEKCNNYSIQPYIGDGCKCVFCKDPKSFKTKNSVKAVPESRLNEIYNIMDVYCHPFTSGGQELPIQEAKSAGLITLVTNYSCGEDSCHPEQGGLPLDWSEYREPHTEFIKASTNPDSICSNLEKVLLMSEDEKGVLLENSKNNIKENFSLEVVIEKLKSEIIDLYNSEFKKEKTEKKQKRSHKHIKHFLGEENPEDRILVLIEQSEQDVLMVNSLIENLKTNYQDKKIYVSTKPKFFPFIEDNPNVYKCIPYCENFKNILPLEGSGKTRGLFDMVFLTNLTTQIYKPYSYIHNGKDKISFFNK